VSGAVDVLSVLDNLICGAKVGGHELRMTRAAVAELIAFVENIAEPMSEPLNSAVGYRNKESRRHFMGVLRNNARAALSNITGAKS
jgi:hypothetical protein